MAVLGADEAQFPFLTWKKDGLINFSTLREGLELLICWSIQDE